MPVKNNYTRAISICLMVIFIGVLGFYYTHYKEQMPGQEHKTPGEVHPAEKKSTVEKPTQSQLQTLELSDQIDGRKAELKQCDAIVGRETMMLTEYERRQSDTKLSASEREDARQKWKQSKDLIASTKKKKAVLENQIAEMEKIK